MDAIWAALADEHRRTMLVALRDGPRTATELTDLVPIARPGASRHLRVLREAGLVTAEQDAQRRVYRLRDEGLQELDSWLQPYRDRWEQRLDALDTEVARGRTERTERTRGTRR